MLRDPITWSLPLGRLFGINVRVHVLFPLVALGVILRTAVQKNPEPIPGAWIDMAMLMGLLFFSVFLHEMGHCFGARSVEGDAQDILMWPLGGLAYVEVPHTPRANLITAAAGPAVNVVLCLLCAAILFGYSYWPPLHPLNWPWRVEANGAIELSRLGVGEAEKVTSLGLIVVARFFWVNWISALINLFLVGFPLDGGRILQAILWRYIGYRQALLTAVFAGFVVTLVVALYAIVMSDILAFGLSLFIYTSCRHEWIMLETGGEEGVFGYDFSQGYTSLEREQTAGSTAPTPRRRQSWWQRWQQRRAARKMQREQEVREAEELRMDELLDKVKRDGFNALSEEEKRFLRRVSDRYRNRQ